MGLLGWALIFLVVAIIAAVCWIWWGCYCLSGYRKDTVRYLFGHIFGSAGYEFCRRGLTQGHIHVSGR